MHLKTDMPLMYEKAAGRRAGRVSPSGLKEKQLAMNSELSGQQGDPRNTGPPSRSRVESWLCNCLVL